MILPLIHVSPRSHIFLLLSYFHSSPFCLFDWYRHQWTVANLSCFYIKCILIIEFYLCPLFFLSKYLICIFLSSHFRPPGIYTTKYTSWFRLFLHGLGGGLIQLHVNDGLHRVSFKLINTSDPYIFCPGHFRQSHQIKSCTGERGTLNIA